MQARWVLLCIILVEAVQPRFDHAGYSLLDLSNHLMGKPALTPEPKPNLKFGSVGVTSLLEQSSRLTHSPTIEEQLTKLTGKTPPPFPPIPASVRANPADALANDANEEVKQLESALSKEELAEEEAEKKPLVLRVLKPARKQLPLGVLSLNLDKLKKEEKSLLKAEADKMEARRESSSGTESDMGGKPDPSLSSPLLTQTHLFELEPAHSTPASMRLLETRVTDENSFQRLNKQETVDQKLLWDLVGRTRASLKGANKLFHHVETHLGNLHKVHKILDDEVALLGLKEKQLLQDRKNQAAASKQAEVVDEPPQEDAEAEEDGGEAEGEGEGPLPDAFVETSINRKAGMEGERSNDNEDFRG